MFAAKLSVFLLLAGALGGSEAIRQVPMALYTIDLGLPPRERWIPLLKDFRSSVPLVEKYFYQQVSHINIWGLYVRET